MGALQFAEFLRSELTQPAVMWQALAVAACCLLAWALARILRARLLQSIAVRPADAHESRPNRWRRLDDLGDLYFPALCWGFMFVVYFTLQRLGKPVNVLNVAMLLAFSFVAVRFLVYAVRRAFAPSEMLLALERVLATVVWLVVALHLLGLLDDLLVLADSLVLPLGQSRLSLLQFLQGVITVGLTVIVALWIGAMLEARLLGVTGMDPSLRAVLSRVGNAVLIILALLVSLGLVGIDVTVLSVFGGALGVGLGLGLQRIASSYVSGFIILLDRSLRLGDLITADKHHGTVIDIRTRYTVIRALDGTEVIVPNDMLASQVVINHSPGNKHGRVSVSLPIQPLTNIDQVLDLLTQTLRDEPMVRSDPAPVALLAGFGMDSLQIELAFSVDDPQKNAGPVRSAINRRVLACLAEQGVELASNNLASARAGTSDAPVRANSSRPEGDLSGKELLPSGDSGQAVQRP